MINNENNENNEKNNNNKNNDNNKLLKRTRTSSVGILPPALSTEAIWWRECA